MLLHGLGGMGDAIHQRAIVRHWMRTHLVWLETSWPWVYADLVASRMLKLVPLRSALRTQAKSEALNRWKYHEALAPRCAVEHRVWYSPADVRKYGGVLPAMLANTGCPQTAIDFSFPKVQEIFIFQTSKPIMVVRPLVERIEWSGCAARNPDTEMYRMLFDSIREDYFVISIADLVAEKEWLVDRPMGCDVALHDGSMDSGKLLSLVQHADLVFCSPGFAAPLAQACRTPLVCVFGGYEKGYSFSAGAELAPYLPIEPINSCDCFEHHHACDKTIDMFNALKNLRDFSNGAFPDTTHSATPETA